MKAWKEEETSKSFLNSFIFFNLRKVLKVWAKRGKKLL